jgi:hypothetical protein
MPQGLEDNIKLDLREEYVRRWNEIKYFMGGFIPHQISFG